MPSMTERLAKRPLFLTDAGREISIGTLDVLIDLEDGRSAFFEELVPIIFEFLGSWYVVERGL